MNRESAIATAAYLRAGNLVFEALYLTDEKGKRHFVRWDRSQQFDSISAAKRHGRTLGRGVAVKSGERIQMEAR